MAYKLSLYLSYLHFSYNLQNFRFFQSPDRPRCNPPIMFPLSLITLTLLTN